MGWYEDYLASKLAEINTLDEEEKQRALDTNMLESTSAYGVKFWLDAGANPDTKDEQGKTKLMLSDDVEVTKVLLNAGANADIEDERGYKAVSYAIDPKAYELLYSKTNMDDKNGYLKARSLRDSAIQWKLNEMFMDAQYDLKSKSNEELMEDMKPYKYEYLLNNLSPEQAEKLDKLIQTINESISVNSYETASLDHLQGMSLNDIEGMLFLKLLKMRHKHM